MKGFLLLRRLRRSDSMKGGKRSARSSKVEESVALTSRDEAILRDVWASL